MGAGPDLDDDHNARCVRRPETFGRKLWRLARAYYTSEEWRSAWAITAAVVALTLLQIALQIGLNLSNRDFFNALEQRDGDEFFWQLGVFTALAVAGIVAAVLQLHARQTLQVWWREWQVRRLQRLLLADSCHYRLQFLPGAADNPDQRISENTRWATSTAVELAIGLLHSALLLVSFVGILWTVSGALPVVLAGHQTEIPGYMVFAAAIYAVVGTWATWAIGRPMTAINALRNEVESDHRFALVRLRENSEGVALIRGEADEERGLRRAFGRVSAVMVDLNRVERRLMGLTSAYGMMTHIFPLLVVSPRYFAGAISLGVLMQVGSAFSEVTKALTWFMTNYPRVADWVSHVDRVIELEDSLRDAARLGTSGAAGRRGSVSVEEGAAADGSEVLRLAGLSVAAPCGAPLVRRADAVVRPGERVLIKGESGTGKSTLFRAIAGAWPWASGSIRMPGRDSAMFMPQRPYLPLGTLGAALAYPAAPGAFTDPEMGAALARCGLARLAERLAEEARWDRILWLGVQQRLAYARALLHGPRWIFMDEATAALDEANQDAMMRLLQEELPGSAVVSIGHRPGLDRYHDRVLTLRASPGGAVLSETVPTPAEPAALPPAPAAAPARRFPAAAPAGRQAPRPRRPHVRIASGTAVPWRPSAVPVAAQHHEQAGDRRPALLPQRGLALRHDVERFGGEGGRMGTVVPIAHGRSQHEWRTAAALPGFERKGGEAAGPQRPGDRGQGRAQIAEVVQDIGGGDEVERRGVLGQPFEQVGLVQRGVDAPPARQREHARREVEAL
ncbi:MAG: ABC transporter ATP-binding protein/permease [Acetobacteraceae bacterium]|nr:ABC transporter ATP-binding protein/permease [Acetobacteraceae bacterium]